jgi:hypothetical protein
MARCEIKPPAPPAPPTEGGTYVVEGSTLKCVQRTAQPGEQPPATADPDPTPED